MAEQDPVQPSNIRQFPLNTRQESERPAHRGTPESAGFNPNSGAAVGRMNEPSWDDAVEPNEDGYSPDTFYVHMQKSAEKVKVQVWVDGEIHRIISKLVSKDSFPLYASNADFWRDAAAHRIHHLAESNYRIPEVELRTIAAFFLRDRIEQAKQYQEVQKEIRETIGDTLREMSMSKDFRGVAKLCDDAWKRLDTFNEPWRSGIREILLEYSDEPPTTAFDDDPDMPPPDYLPPDH